MVADDAAAADAPPGESGRSTFYVEILLVSFAALLLEISYTRIISFKLFYYYTYLVIGLALLGIGAGGVIVAISDACVARLDRGDRDELERPARRRERRRRLRRRRATSALDTFAIWEYGTLVVVHEPRPSRSLICVALFAVVRRGRRRRSSTLFGRRPDADRTALLRRPPRRRAGVRDRRVAARLDRTAGDDLPRGRCSWRSSVCASLWRAPLAGSYATDRGRVLRRAVLPAVVVAAHAGCPRRAAARRRRSSTSTTPNTGYSAWSPIFRVDVPRSASAYACLVPRRAARLGDRSATTATCRASAGFDTDPACAPLRGGRRRRRASESHHRCRRGPRDPRLAALPGAATSTRSSSTRSRTTSLHRHDGRLRRATSPTTRRSTTSTTTAGRTSPASDRKYNLIWYPAPDSYSATNAAIGGRVRALGELPVHERGDRRQPRAPDAARASSPRSSASSTTTHRPNRTTRYVVDGREALEELGIHDPAQPHPGRELRRGSVRHPLDDPRASAAVHAGRDRSLRRRRSPQCRARRSAARARRRGRRRARRQRLLTMPDDKLDAWYAAYPYDVRPIDGRRTVLLALHPFDDVHRRTSPTRSSGTNCEVAGGERVLLLLLLVAIVLAAVFLLLPFVAIRDAGRRSRGRRRSALYFAALGLGLHLLRDHADPAAHAVPRVSRRTRSPSR